MSKLETLDTQSLKYILKNALLDKQEKSQNDFYRLSRLFGLIL